MSQEPRESPDVAFWWKRDNGLAVRCALAGKVSRFRGCWDLPVATEVSMFRGEEVRGRSAPRRRLAGRGRGGRGFEVS